jgi:murein DD-endopeptidase MepM/ murein hydrolase activator NlpD
VIASAVLGKHGRRAMMTTLVAGISVAGISGAAVIAAAVTANQVQAAPISRTQPVPPATDAPVIASSRAGVASVASIEPPPDTRPNLAFARVHRKVKPVVTQTAKWVNPLPEAAVTSCFGHRWGRLHAGVDLAAPEGTPIRAAGAGVVVTAGAAQGYGNAVLIDHGDGFLTHYGHMSVITVPVGLRVAAGQEIGLEGSTGNSTGPHLHFEVHQGSHQNPIEPTGWLREHGVAIPGCAPLAVPAEPPV